MIADSSFIYALLVPHDADHPKAVLDSKAIAQRPVMVPDWVLEEITTALVYDEGIEVALSCVEQIRSNQYFEIFATTAQDRDGVFQLMGQVRRKISFVDYALVYLARERGEGVMTYDKQILSLLKNKPEKR